MNDLKDIINSETRFIRVLWCDNANIIRGKAVHVNSIKNKDVSVGISRAQQGVPVMYDGVVDGSGLDPVGEITLKGDVSTLTPLPYAPGHSRVMGDMIKNGETWGNCPRGFLKRMIKDALDNGLEIKSVFENEFYLLNGGNEPVDSTPFASTYSMDQNQEVIGEIVESLIAQKIMVEQYYPEAGPGQQEITTAYADALRSADNQIAFRETVKAVSAKHGLEASFLPKIFPDKAGNGCHLHLSLWQDDRNILNDENIGNDEYGLSIIAQEFIAGILHHLPALMAITTPIPNSYRRIKPQMWCGAFQCWGLNNREAAVRVIKDDNGMITHFEFKTLDVSSNPYLALGAVIAAGMDGIRRKMKLQPPVQVDPAIYSHREMEEKGIIPLPENLGNALKNLEQDNVILNALRPELSKSYLAVKKAEWDAMKDLSLEEELDLLLDKY